MQGFRNLGIEEFRELTNKSCVKNIRNFFIVFLCELCAFARDFFGSGLCGLGEVNKG